MKNNIKLLDGSMSYPLELDGFNLNNRLWTGNALIDNPELIKKVHLGYINSGADYLLTSTYQISYDILKEKGIDSQEIKKIFQKSLDIAKDAVKESKTNKNIKIVASLGPFASYKKSASEYVGIYDSTDDEILNFHLNNLNVIKDIDYEIILYETIPCLREIKILSMIFEKLNKEIWVSMTCGDDINFRDGSSISEACSILSKFDNITTIGLNCFSPLYVKEAYEILKNNTEKKIILYPNSGEIYNPKEKIWNGNKLYEDKMIKKWLSLSPDIIGGCCRVGYDEIKKMRKEIDNYEK